jgi:type II secretory pathway pseudopilin PulG
MSAGPSSAITFGPEQLQDWSRFGAVVPLFAIGVIGSMWRPLAARIGRRIRPQEGQVVSDLTPAPLVSDPGRLRPTVVLNAVGAGMLLVSLIIFRADPLQEQIGVSLPTYVGVRTSVEDLRTRQLLRQALADMDGYRSEHGTYRGFDLAAAASLDPELTWQEGLPHSAEGPNIPELTMGIVGASSTRAQIVAVSLSGTSICIQRDGNGISYGSSPRIAWNTALPSGVSHAVAACGSTPWTDAALRPFPIAAMCDGLDRDSGYLICRMVQVITTQTMERTGPI